MDKQIITFSANEQNLVRIGGEYHYSSNKVSYIGAHFDLGANWDGFDSVRAVWFTDRINGISTVLDGDGNCTVPTEVLKKKDRVFVNLVGSIVSNGELTDRLTTYPAVALVVDSKAKVDSTETAPVTPSQFEQFVSIVQDAVANIKDIVSTTLNADYTLTFVYSDGTSYTTPSIRGERGPQGADGADGTDGNGIASAVLNSNYTLTLTFTDGTSYTTPSIRGAQGPKGDPGDVSQAQLDAAVSDLRSEINDIEADVGNLSNLETTDKSSIVNAVNELEELFSAPTQEAVDNWLDVHPEATTTVADGAITEAKLNSSLVGDLVIFVSNLSELNSAMTSGKKIIAFKEGTIIEVNSMITIKSGTTVIGNGAKFVRKAGFEGKMIFAEANCNISNIQFDGNRTAMVSPSWDTTIEISLSGFSTLENCIFEHGNECVIAYGDSNRIEHCKFTDCGGNAIHFSGGRYTVVDGCYVNGANKRSGMGHENGCIIWSSECAYATCVNNYCEDGISGFGRVGSEHAGFVKLIGNTTKNCTYAFEIGNTASGTNPAREFVVANNIFDHCVNLRIYKTPNSNPDRSKVTIVGNDFIETKFSANRASNLLFADNNICGDSVQVELTQCASSVIIGNIINNTANIAHAVYASKCSGVTISNNYVRGGKEALWCGESQRIAFDGNMISAYCPSASDVAISLPLNGVFRNNTVCSFGKGFNVANGAMVINNQFWLANSASAVNTYGGTSKCIIKNNMTNHNFTVAGTSNSYVSDNLTEVTTDVFTTVTMTLTNITSNAFASAVLGDDFVCTLTASEGYALPDTITVSVKGETINAAEYDYDKTTGKIIVSGVLGAVVITASGVSV